MTNRHGRQLLDQRQRIYDFIADLTPTTIDDIVRRARFTTTPDGWKARTITDGSPPANSDYAGVEATVDRRAFAGVDDIPQIEHDPTGDSITTLVKLLHQIDQLAQRATDELTYIRNVHNAASDRQKRSTGGPCQCCEREVAGVTSDRLRSGLCEACYSAWRRYLEQTKQPDRVAFITERARTLTAEANNDTTASTSTDTRTGTLPASVAQSAHGGR